MYSGLNIKKKPKALVGGTKKGSMIPIKHSKAEMGVNYLEV